MVIGTPGAYSLAPLTHSPTVTAGFRCAPEVAAAYTPAKTPSPQPKMITM
jgi:hypothetical protein